VGSNPTVGSASFSRLRASSKCVSEPIEVKPLWRRAGGLAFVCEKCLNVRFAEDFPEHAGDERLKLREWLKDRLKAEGHWGVIRAVGTTCLDVCAIGRVTVLIDPVGRGGDQKCLVFDPLEDRELIYQTIVRELAPPAPHAAETEKASH
jgi:hypothetical protein